MRRLRNLCVAMGFTWLAFSGCSAIEPKADPSRFFTLTPLVQIDQDRPQGPAGLGGVSLGIRPIKLPGYLDREQLVTRISQNRFQIAENDRWAEPLEENFKRVLTQNLTSLVPAAQFVDYPWHASERPEYQLEIDVLRFEPDGARNVEMLVRWRIRETATQKTVRVQQTRLVSAVANNTTEAAVAALSVALGELSRELAHATQALGHPINPKGISKKRNFP